MAEKVTQYGVDMKNADGERMSVDFFTDDGAILIRIGDAEWRGVAADFCVGFDMLREKVNPGESLTERLLEVGKLFDQVKGELDELPPPVAAH